jgi:hypothetical protein
MESHKANHALSYYHPTNSLGTTEIGHGDGKPGKGMSYPRAPPSASPPCLGKGYRTPAPPTPAPRTPPPPTDTTAKKVRSGGREQGAGSREQVTHVESSVRMHLTLEQHTATYLFTVSGVRSRCTYVVRTEIANTSPNIAYTRVVKKTRLTLSVERTVDC